MKNRLAVAGAIAQLVRLGVLSVGERGLSHQAVHEPQRRMRHRELGIDLDRALEQRDRGGRIRPRHQTFIRRAVRLQRVERRRRRLLERRIVLLDGRERFADARPERAGDLAQRVQDLFLPRRLHLLLVEDVAGAAVLGAQAQHVLASEAGNRAFERRRRSPVRSQISRATSGVSRASGGWPISAQRRAGCARRTPG